MTGCRPQGVYGCDLIVAGDNDCDRATKRFFEARLSPLDTWQPFYACSKRHADRLRAELVAVGFEVRGEW